MSTVLGELPEKWTLLRSVNRFDTEGLGIPSFPLDTATVHGKLRLALGENGLARLLIPVDVRERLPEGLRTRGLQAGTVVLSVSGKATKFIDLLCMEEPLDQVFKELAADVVRRVSEGHGAMSAVSEAIHDFRRLLLQVRSGDVSREEVIGLLGELYMLDRLLERSTATLPAWVGWSGARHDFVNGAFSAEIKTMMRAHEPIVTINALDQLEIPLNGSLMLAHLIVEENADGDLSVPELVKNCLAKVDDADLFEERLASDGYDVNEPGGWSRFRFSMNEWNCYSVVEGFPRIVSSLFKDGRVPIGVSHIRYRLNLNNASSFLIDQAQEDEFMAGLAGCH